MATQRYKKRARHCFDLLVAEIRLPLPRFDQSLEEKRKEGKTRYEPGHL